MKNKSIKSTLRSIFLGNRYSGLTSINDQVRYMTMNSIFMIVSIPLIIIGISLVRIDMVRAMIDFGIAFICITSLLFMRSKVSLRLIPVIPVTFFGLYCLFLLYQGALNLWVTIWVFLFPLVSIFLLQMTLGIIESVVIFVVSVLFLYTPIAPVSPVNDIKVRFLTAYFLILSLTIVYERISMLKDKKEASLNAELARERDVIQTMKDNIQQGIFLMDKELKILSQYSKPLISILSYYDSELAGKNFLDILAVSLDAKQLQTMKGFFSMIFEKSKSERVLEAVNPISEFEYKLDDQVKYLSTKFRLIEQANSEPVIIGIIQDITREKEFDKELKAQRLAKEMEMKNMFDVIQIDPLVFRDFIEDTEANFNYINAILKDKTLTEKQVVTKFFQNVHAIKSNALILGLETFGLKLHELEDDIKAVLAAEKVNVDDVLSLAMKLETIMQEKDSYIKIINRIESYKTSNRLDSVLVYSLSKAAEKLAAETKKKVELKSGQLDIGILESSLRKPIKDILFQCLRNSIYHGIEPADDRIQKNKKPLGLLAFSIRNTDGKAEIVFSDDGHGLEWDKIKDRYIKLHPNVTAVDRKILLSSIFAPEFSTSEETTTVAGRGVGLSLVMDIVRENHGSIKVDSSEAGLTLKFLFPLNG